MGNRRRRKRNASTSSTSTSSLLLTPPPSPTPSSALVQTPVSPRPIHRERFPPGFHVEQISRDVGSFCAEWLRPGDRLAYIVPKQAASKEIPFKLEAWADGQKLVDGFRPKKSTACLPLDSPKCSSKSKTKPLSNMKTRNKTSPPITPQKQTEQDKYERLMSQFNVLCIGTPEDLTTQSWDQVQEEMEVTGRIIDLWIKEDEEWRRAMAARPALKWNRSLSDTNLLSNLEWCYGGFAD